VCVCARACVSSPRVTLPCVPTATVTLLLIPWIVILIIFPQTSREFNLKLVFICVCSYPFVLIVLKINKKQVTFKVAMTITYPAFLNLCVDENAIGYGLDDRAVIPSDGGGVFFR